MFEPAKLVLVLGLLVCLFPSTESSGGPIAHPKYVLVSGLLLGGTALVVGMVFRSVQIDYLGHSIIFQLALVVAEVALLALVANRLPSRLGNPRKAGRLVGVVSLLLGLLATAL